MAYPGGLVEFFVLLIAWAAFANIGAGVIAVRRVVRLRAGASDPPPWPSFVLWTLAGSLATGIVARTIGFFAERAAAHGVSRSAGGLMIATLVVTVHAPAVGLALASWRVGRAQGASQSRSGGGSLKG